TVAARRAASAAALVEQCDVEAGRVEDLALARTAATARSAMQEEDRQAVGSAAALEVQTVGVADLEQAMHEGRRGREEQGVGRHGVGEMLGMDGIRAGARVARVMASELAAQSRTGGTRAKGGRFMCWILDQRSCGFRLFLLSGCDQVAFAFPHWVPNLRP